MVKELKTENKIVEAAKTVFIRKGMDGARMQEIANEAGINKALLHYYFRTKDKLFEKVFSIAFKEVFSSIDEAISGITDFEEFLESFIRNYILLIKKRPFIPSFVIHELNRKPERIVQYIKQSPFKKEGVFNLIRQAVEDGKIRPIEPVHLITNIIALCIFPFVAKPIITGFALDGDKEKYKQYIEERPDEVVAFVKQAVML
jgi:AcrR family transcriptional regulator